MLCIRYYNNLSEFDDRNKILKEKRELALNGLKEEDDKKEEEKKIQMFTDVVVEYEPIDPFVSKVGMGVIVI